MDEVNKNLKVGSTNLKGSTEQIQNTTYSLEDILEKIEEGDYNMGLVLENESIYRTLERIFSQIDTSIFDF